MHRSLVEKENSFVRLKRFSLKNDPNYVFSKLNDSLGLTFPESPLNIKLKISVYRFLKNLKILKVNRFSEKKLLSNSLGWVLQENGFYFSVVESNKKNKMILLRQKLNSSTSADLVQSVFQRIVCPLSVQADDRGLKSLSKGFDKYLKFYGDSLQTLEKRLTLLRVLKSRKFLSKVYLSRLFLFSTKQKKKYTSTFLYFVRRRQKVKSLLHLFVFSTLKFKYLKRQQRKVVKRWVWKLKKSKKWKRHNSLFWLRQKLSQIFYVPKQFEINYKTWAATYLGFTDFKTINVRIPFRLNVRKLLTFLS